MLNVKPAAAKFDNKNQQTKTIPSAQLERTSKGVNK